MDEGRDDRDGQDGLSRHHGGRGEEKPQKAQRPGMRQDEIEREADHDRRKAEQSVDHHDEEPATREFEHRQRGPRRQRDDGSDDRRG
jgi:hypothetical protein